MRIALLCLAALGCAREGISWGPVAYGGDSIESRVLTETLPPRSGAGCADVVVVGRGAERYAAWWEARENGGSVLMLARSPDAGAHWDEALVADDRDAGGLRCARPAPALFADDRSDYLHVSYHLSPEGSPGVYFTHSMMASKLATSGMGVLHAPVPVSHGERPVRSSVAGRGDTVVVAFEDPNGPKPRILLSLSTGAGHVFGTPVPVSRAGAAATEPRVSLLGDSIRVRWREQIPGGGHRHAARSGKLP